MLKLLTFFTFLQYCFSVCPNGTETSFTNPNDCYIFVTIKAEFINAEGYCRQQGGHIVSVANAFDNLFLSQKASLYFVDSTDTDFWIGANNELSPGGNWAWLDGIPFIYSDWAKGQPENITGSNCASSSITSSYWSAVDCFKTKPFVCMIHATSDTTTTSTLPSTTTSTTTTTVRTSTTTTTATTKQPTCETGWLLYSRTGYCYSTWHITYSWQHAEEHCKQRNSHLVSIHSQAESNFVANLVRSTAPNGTHLCLLNQIWIGLSSNTTGQFWKWTDKTTFDFSGWSPGQYHAHEQTSCVQLMLNDCDGYKMNYWNDLPCDLVMENFVCKKAPSLSI